MIYVSTKTPFMSIVKRAEKLLKLSEDRRVQSAVTNARNAGAGKRRKFGRSDTEGPDDIVEIAKLFDANKTDRSEDILVKGTGKAIGKIMEVGVWFQRRDGFRVRITTGTIGAIDDVEIDQDLADGPQSDAREMSRIDVRRHGGVDASNDETHAELDAVGRLVTREATDTQQIRRPEVAREETRIRHVSVLECAISTT